MNKKTKIMDLEKRRISIYALFQNALSKKDKIKALEQAIKLTRNFCFNHKITLSLTPNGIFISDSKTQEALSIAASLNKLLLRDYQFELAMYLSKGTCHSMLDPNKSINSIELAKCILGMSRFIPSKVLSGFNIKNSKDTGTVSKNPNDSNAKSQPKHIIDHKANLQIMSESISKYKPKFFDLFGYDISGNRKKLISEIISYYKDNPKLEKEIRFYLTQLEGSLNKNRVIQDIELGMFLNLLKDNGYDFTDIHKSLKRLLIAGEHPYKDKKFSIELAEIAANKELELLNSVLEKLKDAKTADQGIKTVVNDWLRTKHQFINKEHIPEKRAAYEKQFHNIFNNLMDILDIKHYKNLPLPKKFHTPKEINKLSMGELVESICTAIAQTNTRNYPEHFYDERYKLMNSLPDHLRHAHQEYIDFSTKQVNSLRILNILQKMRSLESLSSSLLEMFQDDSLHHNFHTYIDRMLSKSSPTKWSCPFTQVVKSEEFKNFIIEALKSAHLRDKELHYYSKIIGNISQYNKIDNFKETRHSNKHHTQH